MTPENPAMSALRNGGPLYLSQVTPHISELSPEGNTELEPGSLAWEALKTDYGKGNRMRAGVCAGALALTGGIGALRMPSVAPAAFVMSTPLLFKNPELATAFSASTLATWNTLSGVALNNFLHSHSNVSGLLKKPLSRATNFLAKTLPGFEAPSSEHDAQAKTPLVKRMGRFCMRQTQRGAAVMGSLGAYIVTSHMSGQSKSETNKLALKCGVNSGLVMGGAIGLSAVGLGQLQKVNPELANTFQDILGKPLFWIGCAGALIVKQAVKNTIEERRGRNSQPLEPAVENSNI